MVAWNYTTHLNDTGDKKNSSSDSSSDSESSRSSSSSSSSSSDSDSSSSSSSDSYVGSSSESYSEREWWQKGEEQDTTFWDTYGFDDGKCDVFWNIRICWGVIKKNIKSLY